ncbi:MAG: lantibiotic dehydratase [Acidobacteriota bacterium]
MSAALPQDLLPGLEIGSPSERELCRGLRSDHELDAHLTPLPGGSWAVWRCVVLRGAGFPASRVEELASRSLAEAAECKLELERQARELQQQCVKRINEALDQLRASGEWSDASRRKPLLKALRALTRGAVPKAATKHPPAESQIAELRAVRERADDAGEVYERAYESAVAQASQALRQVAAWDRFREAVGWQNRRALATALDPLVNRREGAVRNSRQRQHEELVASYLQRYCVKNDTIGFFGPVGWAELTDHGEAIRVELGEGLLERREVYFEHWGIEALARRLERQFALREHLAPRLRSSCSLEASVLRTPFGGTLELDPEQQRLLALCDGMRPAHAAATELIADAASKLEQERQVFRMLDALRRRRVLTWGLEVPLELYPERRLAAQLESIREPRLRAQALCALDEMVAARDRVARAAGDAAAVAESLTHLEQTFTRLTGQRPHRSHGQMYAARELVYEDCRRAIHVELGPRVLERLGPPLSLVLRGARWLAGELAREVNGRLEEIFDELCGQRGSATIDSYPFYSRVLGTVFMAHDRDPALARALASYKQRWRRLLARDLEGGERRVDFTHAELVPRVEAAFGDVAPSWVVSRQVSPDVMIAAESEAALRRGDFELVLGEVHSSNTFVASCFVSQHPEPETLLRGIELDAGGRTVIFPQMLKESWTQRMNLASIPSSFYQYEYADMAPGVVKCHRLPAAGVVVERREHGLVARTRDGRLEFPALDLFGIDLNLVCSAMIGDVLPERQHSPRVTIDRVVISRERWRFPVSELDFARSSRPEERFLSVRRWARDHGLPRTSFFRVSSERKPCYLDCDSPHYVDLFAKMVRGADAENDAVSLSEMLPRGDQIWLRDAEGNRYTSELRMVAIDRAEVSHG